MSTYVLMRLLESAPRRYDWGIRLLTLGCLDKAYDRLARHIQRDERVGWIFFDFGRRCFPLLLWGFGMLALAGCTMLTATFSWAFLLRWGLASFIVVLIFALDLTGSTPVYKSGLHEDRLLRIELDPDQCRAQVFASTCVPQMSLTSITIGSWPHFPEPGSAYSAARVSCNAPSTPCASAARLEMHCRR